jgi:3-oxoacyl-[acyl-carrier protein] reductase
VAEEARSFGVGTLAFLFDQGDPEQVSEVVKASAKRFGSVDITVANAAIRPHQPFFEISVSEWQHVINTNLSSAFYLARAALPYMFERKWGRVIHISGRDGSTGMSDRAHNVTCKAGIHGLTKALAVEFGKHGITANTVSPGPTDTTRNLANYPDFEKRREYWLSNMPLGRLGKPEDIASACAFLASDGAEYVTGQLLHLSGGWVMS